MGYAHDADVFCIGRRWRTSQKARDAGRDTITGKRFGQHVTKVFTNDLPYGKQVADVFNDNNNRNRSDQNNRLRIKMWRLNRRKTNPRRLDNGIKIDHAKCNRNTISHKDGQENWKSTHYPLLTRENNGRKKRNCRNDAGVEVKSRRARAKCHFNCCSRQTNTNDYHNRSHQNGRQKGIEPVRTCNFDDKRHRKEHKTRNYNT